ncbi:uroporphyrinogen decarboxylase [Kibdelosporangium lantanae]
MTTTSPVRRDLADAPLLVAARGQAPTRTPVWFMRQAGRSLPEYRALREGTPMLQACFTPDMVAEITLQPVRRHGVDAAILFSDIVVPLAAAGVGIDIVPGTGPVVAQPVRDLAGVEALPELDPTKLGPVVEAIGILVRELGEIPLIGFAGAPFTLASYLIEGGPQPRTDEGADEVRARGVARAARPDRRLHARVPQRAGRRRYRRDAAVRLVGRCAVRAGLPRVRVPALAEGPGGARVRGHPRIHFGVGTAELLPAMREAGADVVGVDWRLPLDVAVRRLEAADAPKPVVQGNLDPAVLFAGWDAVEREVRRIVAEGEAAAGHVFNLGHGVLPETDPTVLTRVVELVHSIR